MSTNHTTELRSHLDTLASHLAVWHNREPETFDRGATRLAVTEAGPVRLVD